jgi:hypothetical protein
MTGNTAAYTHRTARLVHGEKVLASGGPKTISAPILTGRKPHEVVVEGAGKLLHDNGD